MQELLPDQLKRVWQEVEEQRLSPEAYQSTHDTLIGQYRDLWAQAIRIAPHADLTESLLAELGSYYGLSDPEEVRRRCLQALARIRGEWQEKVDRISAQAVEQFYNESEAMLYELMWWHSLQEDLSPLAYVLALQFALRNGCRSYLDFGSGVGSGGLLFAQHGFAVTLGDISSTSLEFSAWRFGQRAMTATHLDLKQVSLPENAFDMVTAMDVFEHLVEPAEIVHAIWRAMRPGGYLFGRFHAEVDEDRPHHITLDFEPTFQALRDLGFTEVWRDDWVWGHQVFQKA